MESQEPTFSTIQPTRLIVVEPIAILFSLFAFPLQIISQLFIFESVERNLIAKYGMVNISHNINISIDICDMNISDPVVKFNAEVQKEASYFGMFLAISAFIPALFVSLFLGAYSDKAGRKYAILPPLISTMLNTLVYVLVVMLDLPLWYLFIAAVISGLGGFLNTMLLGCFAYISDTTPPENRRFRITVLEMCLLFPGILGPLGAGKLIETIGYMYCFVITLVGQAVIVIYVIFFVPETVRKDPLAKFFDLTHMKRFKELFASKDDSQKSIKLTILLVAFFIGIIPKFDFGLDTLYLKNRPLCMDNVTVGYYMSAALAVTACGGMLFAWLLKYCLSDKTVALVAGLASISQNIYKAFVQNVTMIFISPVFSTCSVLFVPTIRSLMSIIVGKSEQGVVFGCIAFAELICSMIGVAIFNPIYANTQNLLTGFVFITMAVFYFVSCCILIGYIIHYPHERGQSVDITETKNPEEEPLLGSSQSRHSYNTDNK